MKSKDKAFSATELRRLAEKRVQEQQTGATKPATEPDTLRLLHELQVHQVELEMQNEQLVAARDELESVLERFTDLYDFAPVGYLSLDCEGAISQLNHAAGGLLDAPRGELLGRRFDLFVADGSRPALNGSLQKACTSSAKETCEVTLTRKGKDPRQVRIEAVGSGNGKECRVVLIDITDRKQAEEALRESEERFRVAQELSPDGFTILRPIRDEESHVIDFTWVYQNPAIARLTGTEQQGVLGKRLLELFPGHRGSKFFEVYKQVAETHKSCVLESQYAADIPTPRWLRVAVVPIATDIAILAQDITERKEAEEAVAATQRRIQAIIDNATSAIYAFDLEKRFTMANAALSKLLNSTPEQMIGKRRHEFMPKDDARWHEENDRQVIDTGMTLEFEEYSQLKGRSITWLTTKFPLRDEQGRIYALGGISTDISERKRAEEALNQAKQEADRAKEAAEKANEAKDRFLATLSHELRTPLTPILAAAQLLERREDLPVGVWDYVDIIKRNVALEARLIDDLLDLSRITHGKISLSIVDVDVHEVIRRAVETCQVKLHEKELKLSFRLNAKSHVVRGDWARLQQILWNLLSNAVKFTPSKGQIEISTENVTGGDIEIKVVDHGKGIAAEDLPKLFAPFEQGGSSVTRDFGGLGLGLAISRGLAEMHQGTLKAFSDGPGRGSTFVLTLHGEKEKEKEKEKENTCIVAHPESRRILIVEDNQDTGLLMKTVLDSGGHTVHYASSVASALKAAEQEKFDLLICDIGLPDGSGLDVVSSLRKRNAIDKAIAVTGYGMAEDVERFRNAGFDTHLTKPIDIEDLERLIAML